MDYCGKCGNQIPDGTTECPNCTEGANANILTIPTNPPAILKLGGIAIPIRFIFIGIAAILVIIFFFPLFEVSCQGMSISFNGWDAAFGKTISSFGSSEKIQGNILAIFLLIIPIVMVITFLTQKNLSFVDNKVFIFSSILSVAGVIGFIALSVSANNQAEANMLKASFTIWYYLSVILYIVSGLISIGCIFWAKKKDSP